MRGRGHISGNPPRACLVVAVTRNLASFFRLLSFAASRLNPGRAGLVSRPPLSPHRRGFGLAQRAQASDPDLFFGSSSTAKKSFGSRLLSASLVLSLNPRTVSPKRTHFRQRLPSLNPSFCLSSFPLLSGLVPRLSLFTKTAETTTQNAPPTIFFFFFSFSSFFFSFTPLFLLSPSVLRTAGSKKTTTGNG